eukprot:CAMPEP_0204596894 /NCGR_PEP_ID=MMETSP0661-20131031/53506_1 /ASSEMBLY_ACC=CAM_ASM_000606 /TAXON_ID=109239 /ORGANISM="Alexandrium margalefi, Strain AMGDE01CS-322" /LENGTH=591 /DNA_ID=CAMNT_0051607555 /DNA_START=9 /DNA_END=1780 /DNA_ORIENTATION=+
MRQQMAYASQMARRSSSKYAGQQSWPNACSHDESAAALGPAPDERHEVQRPLQAGGAADPRVRGDAQQQAAEERVRPGEQGSREGGAVVLVEGLVHEAVDGDGRQLPQQQADLLDAVDVQACTISDMGQIMPAAYVRAADPADAQPSSEVPGVVLAEHQAARGPVHGVRRLHEAQHGQRQERGDVGVVHEDCVAKAIHLVGVDGLAPERHGAVLREAPPHRGLEPGRLALQLRQPGRPARGAPLLPAPGGLQPGQDRAEAAQLHRGHGVARHVEGEGRRVVGGPEVGAHHAGVPARAAHAVQQRVDRLQRLALEGVGPAAAARHLAQRLQDAPDGRDETRVLQEPLRRAAGPDLGEVGGELQDGEQRVHLELPLEDPGVLHGALRPAAGLKLPEGHVVAVGAGLPLQAPPGKGVRVHIHQDGRDVAVQHPEEEVLQGRVLPPRGEGRVQQRDVGLDLVHAVPQPHGRDVARHHEAVRRAAHQGARGAGMQHCGVQRVRQAIAEQGAQLPRKDRPADDVHDVVHQRGVEGAPRGRRPGVGDARRTGEPAAERRQQEGGRTEAARPRGHPCTQRGHAGAARAPALRTGPPTSL